MFLGLLFLTGTKLGVNLPASIKGMKLKFIWSWKCTYFLTFFFWFFKLNASSKISQNNTFFFTCKWNVLRSNFSYMVSANIILCAIAVYGCYVAVGNPIKYRIKLQFSFDNFVKRRLGTRTEVKNWHFNIDRLIAMMECHGAQIFFKYL